MMLYALFSYDTPKVWLSVLLTCVLAAGGYGIVVLVERLVFHWDRKVELVQ
jgi:ABC-type nitrate/sulfonate/bicarbonate transport system permease component